jgi:hypothetical protein
MENVNKIEIRLDKITTSQVTINIPFGLEFFPVDNTELQQTEFIDSEKQKAVNPIVDIEKYPFYPSFPSINGGQANAYIIEYKTDLTLFDLGFTENDILFNRLPFKKTYLRLNFYDTKDSKTQRLIGRETVHLKIDSNWYTNGQLQPLNTIYATFISNAQNSIYNSIYGEGFNYYWYKTTLPYTIYVKPAVMNAKTGTVTRLYSNSMGSITPPPSLSVAVPLLGVDYIKCDFFEDTTKRQKYYYNLNSDGLSDTQTTEDSLFPTNNKITINLIRY